MKLTAATLLPLLVSGTVMAQSNVAPSAFPLQIKHVVVIVQENRTPDNLFHFLSPLCPIPQGAKGLQACTPSPVTSSCYDISPCGLSNQSGTVQPITLTVAPMAGSANPNHVHSSFEQMCDANTKNGYACRNDGAFHIVTNPANGSYAYVDNTAVTNYNNTPGHLLDPYLTFAEQYGWANYMYQTNQGPSYPAHQFLFTGTSARSLAEDTASTFISENFNGKGALAGCLASAAATNRLLSPTLGTVGTGCAAFDSKSVQECPIANTALNVPPGNAVGSFCSDKPTMASLLDAQKITWKYYAPSAGDIWTAPDAIKSICDPQFTSPADTTLECNPTGEFSTNVDLKLKGADVLNDITQCNLAGVSWIVPNGTWSDHAGGTGNYGPSWVAAIINAIGLNPVCATGKDVGETFWNNTAIVVTWDDWGGWSDNQPPPVIPGLPCTTSNCQADYQYGFRVPLIVVSAYTPPIIDSTNIYDFGSILRMIEAVNGIQEGALQVADARAITDLSAFFQGSFRSYSQVFALEPASYFLGQKAQGGPPSPPDDDGDDD